MVPVGTTQLAALKAVTVRRTSLTKLELTPARIRVSASTDRGARDADQEPPPPELQVPKADKDHERRPSPRLGATSGGSAPAGA